MIRTSECIYFPSRSIPIGLDNSLVEFQIGNQLEQYMMKEVKRHRILTSCANQIEIFSSFEI